MHNLKAALKSAFKSQLNATPVALTANFSAANERILENRSAIKKADTIADGSEIQAALRSGFGKAGSAIVAIGDHPDFMHLEGTEQSEYHYIATLFMDIAGSTRLGRLYPLEKVKRIKNGFMKLAIAIVQAFDGHVHRLQGDAVMAYFGGKQCTPEQATIDALNAGSVILYLADKIVAPELRHEGIDEPPGIRIGVDYGKKEDVLWSSYGYYGTSEVTATSYYVDVAAKLQHVAPKNGMMIGESITTYLDIPEHLLSLKTSISNGETVEEKFVMPNYSGLDGKKFNYRQWRFNADKYLKSTSLAAVDPELRSNTQAAGSFDVSATVHSAEKGEALHDYFPCSSALKKGQWLCFKLQLPIALGIPYQVEFEVTNHGEDARQRGGENHGNHKTPIKVSTHTEHKELQHWEHTEFRGLHYMTIRVQSPSLQAERRFGVYVE